MGARKRPHVILHSQNTKKGFHLAICPIHNHSNYSKLDGLSTVKDIVQRAVDLNLPAVGLTDHDIVSGHVDFYNAMSSAGLKPLLGIETYQAPQTRLTNMGSLNEKGTKNKIENFHLILLAQTNRGLKNLWSMNTEAHRSGFYYNGRVDWELLRKFNEGIICTSACASGMLSAYIRQNKNYEEVLKNYLDIFGDRFYIELSTYSGEFQKDVNRELVSLSKRWGIPTVYGNDAHYAFPEQYDLHEAILAIQYNEKLADLKEPHHEPCLYIMDEDDVRSHLSYLDKSIVDDAIANTMDIAEKCNVTLPDYKDRTPAFIPDKGWKNSWDMFFDLVKEGYQEKIVDKGKASDVYFSRLSKELEVIKNANLFDYFLIVRDYIENARKQDIIVGPGRGSIGGSLVAYLIGITSIDAVQHGLIFERFYNQGRKKSRPDIDTDFSTKGRDKVKNYVASKYGPKYVSDLGTTIGLKSKGAINDVGRVLGIPIPEVRAISAIIDKTIVAGIQADWDTINQEVGKELAPYRAKYPQMFEWSEQLFDHIRTYGVHASGVIIGDDELDGLFPLRWVTKDKKLVTQWPMETAEDFGYMKMDFLGLRTLDTLEEVNNILKESKQTPIDYESLHDQTFPEEMWMLLDKGLTVGLFQIEDGVAKNLVKRMKCRNLSDLIDFLALNRPGPDIEAYLNGRNGGMVTYAHPLIENVTKSTYGMFLYQEQIIEFMQQLGYSLEQADNFRSVMGKKKVSEINKEKTLFFSKATDFMSDAQTQKIWHMIENFSKYGFNKSHAVGYAIILLRTLYAKWAYSAEFILAGIRTVDKPEIKRYLSEGRKMGITILAPNINRSERRTVIKNNSIQFGFSDIKFFSDTSADWIIANRPFASLDELKQKIQDNKGTLPNGVRRVVLTSKHIEILTQICALEGVEGVDQNPDEDERINAEEEYIGIAFSDKTARILEQYEEEISQNCTPINAIDLPGNYLIAGSIAKIEDKVTKAGKKYLRVWIRDIDDQDIEICVWDQERERFRFMWRRNIVGIFSIRKTEKGVSLKDAKTLFDRESR